MNSTVFACCGTPLDEWSRTDRRTCCATCRVSLWRAQKAGRAPICGQVDSKPMAASSRRHSAA
jgi:hypothetical protein